MDVWAPLGSSGRTPVADELTARQRFATPARAPHTHRCDITVAGRRVDLSWHEEHTLVASLLDPDGTAHELARGERRVPGDGPGSIVWAHHVMPLTVGADPIQVERRPSGRDRWLWEVSAGTERSWTFRPGGLVFADRVELTRAGERSPVVVHELRPVPGVPRSAGGPPRVSWDERASLVEVLMTVMWVLDNAYRGLLPKAQRVVQGDVL